jgi:hypothetical protein
MERCGISQGFVQNSFSRIVGQEERGGGGEVCGGKTVRECIGRAPCFFAIVVFCSRPLSRQLAKAGRNCYSERRQYKTGKEGGEGALGLKTTAKKQVSLPVYSLYFIL